MKSLAPSGEGGGIGDSLEVGCKAEVSLPNPH